MRLNKSTTAAQRAASFEGSRCVDKPSAQRPRALSTSLSSVSPSTFTKLTARLSEDLVVRRRSLRASSGSGGDERFRSIARVNCSRFNTPSQLMKSSLRLSRRLAEISESTPCSGVASFGRPRKRWSMELLSESPPGPILRCRSRLLSCWTLSCACSCSVGKKEFFDGDKAPLCAEDGIFRDRSSDSSMASCIFCFLGPCSAETMATALGRRWPQHVERHAP
mmetsp:Transcript_8198/g.20637  ORF Transcript_8198/g.20637 Transcript_8198/m.20637 type:complete len:222 (+) Transcript_8198:89-754(+)